MCAAMAATAVAQNEPKPEPSQTEPKQADQGATDASKALSPTGPHVIKASDSKTIRATVEDIDPATRTVTLKGEGGKTVDVELGDEVRNFDQIKKGDQVTVKYYQSIALGLRKSDEPPSTEVQSAVLRSEPGQKPGGAMIKTMQVSATIESISASTIEITRSRVTWASA